LSFTNHYGFQVAVLDFLEKVINEQSDLMFANNLVCFYFLFLISFVARFNCKSNDNMARNVAINILPELCFLRTNSCQFNV
jgi:hypothetical protein